MATPNDKFAFDSKSLISFCKRSDIMQTSNQSDAILDIKMKDLDCRWVKVEQSYEVIMLSDQSEETKNQVREQYDTCMEVYYLTMSKILDVISPNRPSMSANTMPTVPNSSEETFSTSLKLPPCDTQTFSGSYEEWPAFRDMFTAVYINHPRLTFAERLYHLRNKTAGTASQIVNRFPLTEDNFNLAWQALKSRYENIRVLVDNQIQNLFNIPMANSEDGESLQRIHSSVTDCLAMLKSFGVSSEGWDPILVNLVYSKLPHGTLSQWEQSLNASRDLPKWSQLSDFLLKRCEVVERIASIRLTKTPSNNHSKGQTRIQTYASQEKLTFNCRLCAEQHGLRTCPQFRNFSIQERVDFVFKNKICNNCLSVSHTKSNCKSKNTCLNCGKTHHTLLHMRQSNNFRKNGNPIQSSNIKNSHIQNSDSQVNIPLTQVPKSQVLRNRSPQGHSFRSQDYQGQNVASHAQMQGEQLQQTQIPLSTQPSTSSAAKYNQVHSNYAANSTNILLRTALVQIESRGELFTVRALIDPGSERTFLSEEIRVRLNLPFRKSKFHIIGIGGKSQTADKECDITLGSKQNNFRLQISAIVLPRVTNKIPSTSFKISCTSGLSDMELADPYFNVSSPIDLILGNDSERHINLDGIRRDVCGIASAYKTIFGWVLSGPIPTQPIFSFSSQVNPPESSDLNELLRKFWEQEEIPTVKQISSEDQYCEDFYTKTTKRLPDGRYMVRLPFRKEFPDTKYLGTSRFIALSQYVRMEQTLAKNIALNQQYNEVLNEYLTLNHMEETTAIEYLSNGKCNSFYLPHHAVLRPDSKTTKVRIVFNASRKTRSGFSLNDILYTGPTLQADLVNVILNWRFYRYVFSGDIQKMYRQILVNPLDRPFQRILFQKSSREAVKDYHMKTVTFGINCAPFLAIRTLLQLASDAQNLFPKAAHILKNETYVDDILAGGHSIESALDAQAQLIQSLESASFPLKKITSNDSRLLDRIPKEDLYDLNFLKFYDTSATKTLGIRWNALTDYFTYTFEPPLEIPTTTKRQVLSSVAKLFDPAGWISPVIIRGKILIQQLWLEKLDWDDPIGQDSLQIWNELIKDLQYVEKIQIPRWLRFTPVDQVQIHGFCDASQKAYCAAIYIRIKTSAAVFSNLLVSKTKVAPLAAITLPRLELSGALMLSKLMAHTVSSLNLQDHEIYLWCDSSIVLGWLAKPPATWKEIYVSNRVSQIHTLLPKAKWLHVPTHTNPADLGSRGCRPQDLIVNDLWWNGPAWLCHPPQEWPKPNGVDTPKSSRRSSHKSTIIELSDTVFSHKVQVNVDSLHANRDFVDILAEFSSYTRALRVLAYIFRFIRKFKPSFANPTLSVSSGDVNLSHSEISSVKTRMILLAQIQGFTTEYMTLSKSEPILKNSPLYTLNPFLDENAILRVNGRLANSTLPYNERYPIILPGHSRFCNLYLSHLHTFLIHGECQLMCRMVQTEFYIPRLKVRIRKIIRHCKTCIVYKRKSCSQIMAALPSDRCSLSFPFHITGLDFAGPFELKASTQRNSRTVKSYVCVFVCFATHAIHLEPCSSLSTVAFQATFARFVGRRGFPHKILSDNGRNFVGASRAFRREFSTFMGMISEDITQKYITHGFKWTFIPPHAPHMGGIWEAAVKSFKFHLKRVAGAYRFNFEEFATLLARIEGVLNSRPISPLSENPSDLAVLTPGHFLRGGPLMAIPEPIIENLPLLTRWEKLKAFHHQFAIQWKADYLHNLHKRYKWKFSIPNLKLGDFVIVIDDILPPNEWRLGRIENVYPGPDQKVRVVDVRTAAGILTRPITKLCYLPYNETQGSAL